MPSARSAPRALKDLFNATIRALAAFGVFMAEVMVAVDGMRVVTPPTFQGCDKLSVTERRRNRQGVQVEVVEFPFDWRLTLAPHCVWCSADVAFAYRLWDKAQAGAVVDAPDHQIAQVVHRVIDGQTGAVSVAPEPKRMWRTHLASRMEELYVPPTKPTVPIWSHEQR